MARLARVVLPGRPHHITQRGVRSVEIFNDDEDREVYLDLMAAQGQLHGVTFAAWCLMSNHVHLIAIPKRADSLARAIGEAHRRYTRSINRDEGVRGYLFQGRFYSCPLDEPHLVAAARYIERNPVRARMVKQAWDWPWSSARYHVGLRRSDPLVDDPTMFGLIHDWRRLLRTDPEDVDDLRERTRTGRPCGSAAFIRRAERRTGRVLRKGKPGRPPGSGGKTRRRK